MECRLALCGARVLIRLAKINLLTQLIKIPLCSQVREGHGVAGKAAPPARSSGELSETIYFGIQKRLKAKSEEGVEGGFDICKGRIG